MGGVEQPTSSKVINHLTRAHLLEALWLFLRERL